MIEVCGVINQINKVLSDDILTLGQYFPDDELGYTAYCPNAKEGEKGKCVTNGDRISAGFIWLLEMFKALDGVENLKDINDQYVEYAILWLCFKNKLINPDMYVSITGIYDILERNNPIWYNEFRNKIEKKKRLMNFDDYHMGKLYELLKEMCTLITKYNVDSSHPDAYLNYANKCANTYKDLVSNVSKVKNCDSYCNVLSTLKNAYDKFREEKIMHDPECKLPEFNVEEIESCESLCKKKSQEPAIKNPIAKESEIDTPPKISLPVRSTTELTDNRENTLSVNEVQMDDPKSITLPSVIPTSINNGNKLPYIAVPFILIPVIFGISYKYLTLMWKKKMKSKKNVRKIINLSDKK
ncbi:CIR protein [Plasmodium chabaudi chabaudi]|uniref:CIR protein n=1 Tax=Plasmodium chabaudi chabaudi TaxID=31271 RepID=A0A4V0K421_PLACU|nr:CIR protein [Plasmodium chabaudi chabaudi]VTZ67119.1 CIR protein [Plasmodium chabaudi chabaudi]|eukprot:XP_016652872.1 CIR protein [Plasmodium chabaudi chabaudi]